MNLKETDLNLFIAFDVIYTEKNLTKAGQVLGITQPAVSNALSRLRELFDDELFFKEILNDEGFNGIHLYKKIYPLK